MESHELYAHLIGIRQVNDDAWVVGRLVSFALVVRYNLGSIPKTHELEKFQTIDLSFQHKINVAQISGRLLMKIDYLIFIFFHFCRA